jgi:hypothetical protein
VHDAIYSLSEVGILYRDWARSLWDATTFAVKATVPLPHIFRGRPLSPDGRTLAGCDRKVVRLWDVAKVLKLAKDSK